MASIVFARRGQSPASRPLRFTTASVSVLALTAVFAQAHAQQPTQLPTVPVAPPAAPAQKAAQPKAAPKQQSAPVAKAQPKQQPAQAAQPQASTADVSAPLAGTSLATAGADISSLGANGGSLTVPNTEQAKALIERTPGGVALVPGTVWRDTQATTPKDVLDFVPGVWVRPKWGEDSRLSIRGSGLSRNFHLRSTQLYMDGIPLNTADGYGDFQEIDPSAYKYVEVYKGGNALRFGGNSLGGAINFVTPTGRDASIAQGRVDFGSFGFKRLQASSGAASGAFDAFVTGSWQEQEGFRDHSSGEALRGSANVGIRVNQDVETRFYINANQVRQRIPGPVTRDIALTAPKTADPTNVLNDWQRNIDTVRLANRSVVRFSPNTMLEFGFFGVDRHLMHPIFQWLDEKHTDLGTFARLVDERRIGDFKNRFLVGINIHNGETDRERFEIGPGASKGALTFKTNDTSRNTSVYGENQFYFLPNVAAVAGVQFLHATRDRKDLFLANGDQSGRTEFNLTSPKVGLLWDITRNWQAFANVSRSAEVPSYDESVDNFGFLPFANVPFTDIKAQRATTYEIGTRGRLPDYTWDLVAYRSEINNELMCIQNNSLGNCNVTNADQTVHQGLEIGLGVTVVKGIVEQAGRLARVSHHG